MRTQKETSKVIAKTIKQIRKKGITNQLISATCSDNNVSENYIRKIAGWDNRNKKFN